VYPTDEPNRLAVPATLAVHLDDNADGRAAGAAETPTPIARCDIVE
jgi:hypothetical protein